MIDLRSSSAAICVRRHRPDRAVADCPNQQCWL